jgi:UDP-N-acetylglucosamine 4,6-dehydratase
VDDAIELAYRGISGVLVPDAATMRIVDLVRAIAPDCPTRLVGIQPGEKLHEQMIAQDEARIAYRWQDNFLMTDCKLGSEAEPVPDRFSLSSGTGPHMSREELLLRLSDLDWCGDEMILRR